MMKKNPLRRISSSCSSLFLTKSVVDTAFPTNEFTYSDPPSSSSSSLESNNINNAVDDENDDDDVEATFGSFDQMYLEVDDSLSLQSSPSLWLAANRRGPFQTRDAAAPTTTAAMGGSGGHGSRTTTVVDDLELPTTPTTVTSWFSLSPSPRGGGKNNNNGNNNNGNNNNVVHHYSNCLEESVATLRWKNHRTRYYQKKSSCASSSSSSSCGRGTNDEPDDPISSSTTMDDNDDAARYYCGGRWWRAKRIGGCRNRQGYTGWDVMIVSLCVVILAGCALLLMAVVQVQKKNNSMPSTACGNNASPASLSLPGPAAVPSPYQHERSNNETDDVLAQRIRLNVLQDWLSLANDDDGDSAALIGSSSPQRQALEWLGGAGGGDLEYILGRDLPSKQDYDRLYQQYHHSSQNQGPGHPQFPNNNSTSPGSDSSSSGMNNHHPRPSKEQEEQDQAYYFELEYFRHRLAQRYGLLVLYFTLGRTYPVLGWATLSGARLHECDWPNVSCGGSGDHQVDDDGNEEQQRLYVTQLQLDARMAGRIPSEIGLLTKLETLRIEGARITGAVPSEIYSLTNLYSLAVTNTPGLVSKIPARIGTSLSNLISLDLRNGGFVGRVPTELGQLTSLRYLLLDTNDLVGQIPAELGVLTALDQATFHDTWMSGRMPPAVCQLKQSAVLQNLTANCMVHQDDDDDAVDEGDWQVTPSLAATAAMEGIRLLSNLRVPCECCTLCV